MILYSPRIVLVNEGPKEKLIKPLMKWILIWQMAFDIARAL